MPEKNIQTVSSEQSLHREPDLPDTTEIRVLDLTERAGFRLAHRMNQGVWKQMMTFGQRHIGSLWIYLATYNLMNVFGIENVENSDVDTPLVLVANHRSFFDMYTVSSVIFRRTKRPVKLFFPVRAKFFYDNPVGWFVNFLMGWFSMYPPFFREDREVKKREFDKYSLRRLIQICSEGRANMIGFHPEGKRNLDGGPYEYLPAQPGIGKVIYSAHPQVIPVFIGG
ncbi:MAG: lysophospholipid acyltransferase family protein, partial [Pyrinomonadaceae bacterium]